MKPGSLPRHPNGPYQVPNSFKFTEIIKKVIFGTLQIKKYLVY